MKVNKEFGSSRNEGYKTTKNEINEGLGKEDDERQQNKSLLINREELKDNSKNQVETKLWNIKWKEVMSRKQERL